MSAKVQTGRERAAAVLDVEPDAAPDAVRTALLRRVARENFAPAEECMIAANALAGTTLPLSPDGLAEAAASQRADVEAFAAEYWSFKPSQRRTRWLELSQQSSDSQVRSRLANLEDGLTRGSPALDNPLVQELADAVRELYVLGPRERSVRRAHWFADRCDRIADYRDAARRFRVDAPELAELEPEFLHDLAKGISFAPVRAIDRSVAEAERAQRAVQAAAQVQEQIVRTRPQAPPSSGGTTNTKGIGCVVMFVCFALIRACTASLSTSTDRAPQYTPPRTNFTAPPSYTPPPQTPMPWMLKDSKFEAYELKSFLDYEARQEQGLIDIGPPPRYNLWIIAGRPGAPKAKTPNKVPR